MREAAAILNLYENDIANTNSKRNSIKHNLLLIIVDVSF